MYEHIDGKVHEKPVNIKKEKILQTDSEKE